MHNALPRRLVTLALAQECRWLTGVVQTLHTSRLKMRTRPARLEMVVVGTGTLGRLSPCLLYASYTKPAREYTRPVPSSSGIYPRNSQYKTCKGIGSKSSFSTSRAGCAEKYILSKVSTASGERYSKEPVKPYLVKSRSPEEYIVRPTRPPMR